MRRIDLSSGNFDGGDLEGRVIVYAKFKCLPDKVFNAEWEGKKRVFKNGYVLAKYNCLRARDIVEITNTPPKNVDAKIQKIEDILRNWYAENEKQGKEAFGLLKVVLTADSEETLLANTKSNEDLVYVGKFSNLCNCVHALKAGEDLYEIMLKEQIDKKKQGNESYLKYHDIITSKFEPEKVYSDFKGRSIKEYIKTNYVDRMISAHQTGDESLFSKLKNSLIWFSADGPFIDDARELCNVIKNSESNPDWRLIEIYLEKIDAIHLEKYECAAKLRDEIKKLSKDNTDKS